MLHVDLDQFIAAVEVLRRPELRGKPVVVGGAGDPTQRAVVATATYEAREFGVKSGMPLRTAAKRCPDAVFLPSDPPAYEAVSERVMALLRELCPVVEVLGWDEAFLEVHTDDPEAKAREIQQAILEQEDLHCSVGIGDNKLRAKLATGFGKPQGMFRLTEDNWYPVMAKLPTDALWGIGPKTAKKLAEMEIHTVADLALSDPHDLAARFGPTMGPWFRRLSRGADNSKVEGTPYVQRSHSRETTFQANLTDWDVVRQEIEKLAARVTDDVLADGRPAVRVGVKLRFAPFQTHTASVPLAEPTTDVRVITAGALAALAKFEPGRAIRLLGVKAEFPPVDG
ncbi:DNA polymerase IV [Flindersiella endophytica]